MADGERPLEAVAVAPSLPEAFALQGPGEQRVQDRSALLDVTGVLYRVDPSACRLLTSRGVAVLAAHPRARAGDLHTLSHRLWEDARARAYDNSGRTIEQALAAAFVAGPTIACMDVLRTLLTARDSLHDLQAQRDAISAALEHLAPLAVKR